MRERLKRTLAAPPGEYVKFSCHLAFFVNQRA
jgi:hypothetical protein